MTLSETDIDLNRQESTLRLRRHFACPPDRLWKALIDDELMSAWYPTAVTIEPKVGGRMTLTFPGGEPEEGTVVDYEPEHRLGFEGGGVRVDITLRPTDDGTELDFTTGVPDIDHSASLAAGYDLSLDQLNVLLTNGPEAVTRTEMPPPADLVERYATTYGLPTDT